MCKEINLRVLMLEKAVTKTSFTHEVCNIFLMLLPLCIFFKKCSFFYIFFSLKGKTSTETMSEEGKQSNGPNEGENELNKVEDVLIKVNVQSQLALISV